jgi:hypothetical protein
LFVLLFFGNFYLLLPTTTTHHHFASPRMRSHLRQQNLSRLRVEKLGCVGLDLKGRRACLRAPCPRRKSSGEEIVSPVRQTAGPLVALATSIEPRRSIKNRRGRTQRPCAGATNASRKRNREQQGRRDRDSAQAQVPARGYFRRYRHGASNRQLALRRACR